MKLHRFRRRVVAWLACFAVLLAALAPTVSHAINAYRLDETAQLCQNHAHEDAGAHAHAEGMPDLAAGEQALAIHKQSTGAGHDRGLHFEHCPFCFTHAGSFGLAPPVTAPALPVAMVQSAPLLFLRASHPLFAWAGAQPRAPPVFS